MGIFDFLKGNKEEKEVNRIILNVKQKHEVMKTVDKAISLRSLNRNSEAIALLKQVIKEFPFYKPALSILGNTYLKIGEVDKAETVFRGMINDCKNTEYSALIIEAYCNLGNLYYAYKKDKLKAIEYYEKSLTVIDPASVYDFNKYNIIVSGAYMGLCNIYALENDIYKAKNAALKCINLNPNVVLVNRIYGIIVANALLRMPHIDIFKKNDLITELKQAKKSLESVLCDDDIDALYAMCIVAHTICVLINLGCISSDHNIERKSIESERDKYHKMLEDLSHQSDDANRNFNCYNEYIVSIGTAGMLFKFYTVSQKR